MCWSHNLWVPYQPSTNLPETAHMTVMLQRRLELACWQASIPFHVWAVEHHLTLPADECDYWKLSYVFPFSLTKTKKIKLWALTKNWWNWAPNLFLSPFFYKSIYLICILNIIRFLWLVQPIIMTYYRPFHFRRVATQHMLSGSNAFYHFSSFLAKYESWIIFHSL